MGFLCNGSGQPGPFLFFQQQKGCCEWDLTRSLGPRAERERENSFCFFACLDFFVLLRQGEPSLFFSETLEDGEKVERAANLVEANTNRCEGEALQRNSSRPARIDVKVKLCRESRRRKLVRRWSLQGAACGHCWTYWLQGDGDVDPSMSSTSLSSPSLLRFFFFPLLHKWLQYI